MPTPVSADHALRQQIAAAGAWSADGCDELLVATLRKSLRQAGAPADAEAATQHARALVLIAQSLVRLGRYDEAALAYAEAPRRFSGPDVAEIQAHVLAGTGFLFAHRSMPDEAAQMATAALQIAFAHGLHVPASHALECVGICHAMRGQLRQAEHLMVESLGVALQSGDDATVLRRLSNLVFLAQLVADERRRLRDAPGESDAMVRCARFVAQGDRLARRAGRYERCMWRANRAGWLRRRGLLAEARSEYEAIECEGSAHGWATMVANVRLELALVLREQGDSESALRLLQALTEAAPAQPDSYDTRLHAHAFAAELAAEGGWHELAGRHRARCRELGAQRERERRAAARVLPQISDAIVQALADADRARIAAEAQRVRSDARRVAASFVGADAADVAGVAELATVAGVAEVAGTGRPGR